MSNETLTTALIALTRELIQRPSITPEDAGCQQMLANRLARHGFHVEHFPYDDTENLWVRYGSQAPLLVYVGHTDVVPPGRETAWQSPPFAANVLENKIIGRGACDMKGGVAAMVIAMESFIEKYPNFPGSIAMLLTSDEEGPATNGIKRVLPTLIKQTGQIDYCIGGEPTSISQLGDMVKIGRRGSLNATLIIHGTQGHIAYPHLADNPIHLALPLLNELIAIKWDNGNADFEPTSLQISNIHAGTGTSNVIPGDIEITFNFRYSPEVTHTELQMRVTRLLEQANLSYDIKWRLSGKPFYSKKGKLLDTTIQCIEKICQCTPDISTNGGTSDVRFMAPHCNECVEIGLTHATIHQVNEQVDQDELICLQKLYADILQNLFITS